MILFYTGHVWEEFDQKLGFDFLSLVNHGESGDNALACFKFVTRSNQIRVQIFNVRRHQSKTGRKPV